MLKDLLSLNNWKSYNVALAKKYGIETSIMLFELVGEYDYFESRGQIENWWFYSTIENVENNTALGRRAQETAIKQLVELGWIEKSVKGIPPKRYFKINMELIENDLTTQFVQSDKLNMSDLTTNNINGINNIKNNIIADFDKSAVTPKKVEKWDGNYKESDSDNLYGRPADSAPAVKWIEENEEKPVFTGWQEMPVINKKLRF